MAGNLNLGSRYPITTVSRQNRSTQFPNKNPKNSSLWVWRAWLGSKPSMLDYKLRVPILQYINILIHTAKSISKFKVRYPARRYFGFRRIFKPMQCVKFSSGRFCYSSNEIRKTQNEHLDIVCQNLNSQ